VYNKSGRFLSKERGKLSVKQRSLLLIDAIINLVLGGLLMFCPTEVANFLGVPRITPRFYPTILGAVLFGIGLALLIESARFMRITGLGVGGAIAINLSGGIALAVLLILDKLYLPLKGYFFLWGLVILLVGFSTLELISYIKRNKKIKIDHVALWTNDLERLRDFYYFWFKVEFSRKYSNPNSGFQSYFLSFESGARLEIMHAPNIPKTHPGRKLGYAHIAISVGSEEAVRELTGRMQAAGIPVTSQPRKTGDGYFESIVLDPDGNNIEITI
jgi:lactoylglutathione lyase